MQLFADRHTVDVVLNTPTHTSVPACWYSASRWSARVLHPNANMWCWRIYCGGELESSGGDAINTGLNDLFTFRILTFAYNVMF